MAQVPLASLSSAQCILGEVRQGHGLKLVLKFPKFADIHTVTDVQLDLCGDVYAALPPGTATAANWMLPLKVRGIFDSNASCDKYKRPQEHNTDLSASVEMCYTFTLGARKLSHGTLKKLLTDLAQSGDPPFVMDLLCSYKGQPRLLCRVATTASGMQLALDSTNHEVQLIDPVPEWLAAKANARRAPSLLGVALVLLRWWMLPLLFTALAVGLLVSPSAVICTVSSFLPRVIRLEKSIMVKRIASVLPPVPESLSQAFQLGDLSARYFASSPRWRDATLLAEAATLLSRAEPLSEEELAGVLGHLHSLERHVGLITRVKGFFTFVNTMWLLAIIGIAASIGPSLFVILRPLRDLLKRWAKWMFHQVITPLVRRLHDYGVLEVLVWLICGGILLEAQEHIGEDIALYIASTGIALACPALTYSTFRHAGKLKSKNPHALPRMVSIWLATTAAAMAMAHDSTFLGYVSVVAFYAAIGFQVAAYGLCISIGFDDDTAMERCAVMSLLLLSSMGLARFLNNSLSVGMKLTPFHSAVSVFGCIILFLALLIMSSRFYQPYQHQSLRQRFRMGSYQFVNAATLFLLLGFMAMGSVGGLHGMANTATVFFVLWLVEKYADFHCSSDWNGWVLVLVLSLIAWRSALWLHLRPEFVASLFDI